MALPGCAAERLPQGYADGVNWITEKHEVRDAKAQRVTHWPCLRVDPVLADQLDGLLKEPDLARAKEQACQFLDEAHRLALESASNELGRLDADGWKELTTIYFNVDVEPTDEVKQTLAQEFRNRTDTQVWFLRRQVEVARDVAAIRAALEPIRLRIEPSVKTENRFAQTAPLLLFSLPAKLAQESIHNDEATCQQDETFEAAVHYEPAVEPAAGGPGNVNPTVKDWDLLRRFAPTIVQERPATLKYAATADELGRVKINDDASITIDTAQPAVYGYARTVLIAGRPHVQLIYAIWYPEHPRLKGAFDPEAGKIDGATIRITLDARKQPALFETLNNCGCHHRIYPTLAIEAAARAQFGAPLSGKLFSVERDVEGKYDLIIPKAIDSSAGERPLVRCRAGTHAVVDVDFTDKHHAGEPVAQRRGYSLLSYDDLESLRSPGGKVMSMFESNGLVRGAERMEGELFKPLGMLNAGQPRQRGTQLIHWDQYDFDSPKLLENTLRIPASF
jgi:hypothetical protein